MRVFPFPEGQTYIITRGEFRGTLARIDRAASFYEPKDTYYLGNPDEGICSRAGWQVVVDTQVPDGRWLYTFRVHEDEFRSYSRPVEAT